MLAKERQGRQRRMPERADEVSLDKQAFWEYSKLHFLIRPRKRVFHEPGAFSVKTGEVLERPGT